MSETLDLIGDIAADVINLLRARTPPVRITVRLGDVDAVLEDITTVHGKKQRLQALGHYYETITASNANTASEAYTNCLAYWTQKRNNPADLEADMQAQLRDFVVDSNTLPAVGAETNINLPNSHCYTNINQLGGAGAAASGALPSHRYNAEVAYWAGNPMLGMIPLIALVEVQAADGTWSPLADNWVHFQLIPPYHDDLPGELADVNTLRGTSEQGQVVAGVVTSVIVPSTGPKVFINAAVTHQYSATDPQGYNAHSSRGGKRSLAVLGNVAKDLPTAGFPNLATLEASAHDHTVRGKSNAAGEVGIGFSPSFIGGDRYRWRVFVDPISARASDGTEAHAVKFETGRFCVKKHVLWSRLISKANPTFAASNTVLGMQERLWILGYDTSIRDGIIGRRTKKAIGVFQSHNAALPQTGRRGHRSETHAATQAALDAASTQYLARAGNAVGAIDYVFVEDEFSTMHCKLEIEPVAKVATPISAAEYQAAIQWARTQVQASPPAGLSQRYNIVAMFEDYFNTPFLLDVKEPIYYNRSRGRGVPRARRGRRAAAYTNYWSDVDTAIYGTGGMLENLFLYFTGQGSVATPPTATINHNSTPGLTVITASRASPIMIPNDTPQTSIKAQNGSGNASGIGGNKRACSVFYGRGLYNNWPYQGDGFSRNTMHEMGHVLYKRHHNTSAAAASGFPADHDRADRCVMGYRFCEGQFCGKCNLKLRGWDISQLAP